VGTGLRISLLVTAASLVLAGAATGAGAVRQHAVLGTVAGADRPAVDVDRGDRISIAVRDRGASVGDSWTATTTPAGTLGPVAERNVPSGWWERLSGRDGDLSGGGDGTTYFVYEAEQSGSATVTLVNCFQGCDEPSPFSRSVTWKITVR
jgi:hypothetical protein